jgi:hypothetical protein
MCRHDHIGIDPEIFLLNAEVQTICNDLAGGLIKKYRQSLNNTERDIIQPHALDDAITFHADIIFLEGDLRSKASAG